MNEIIPRKYSGIVGLGLLYLWGCAAFFWVDWLNSYSALEKVIGIIGSLFVAASGIAVFIYTNSVESRLRELEAESARRISEVEYLKGQPKE